MEIIQKKFGFVPMLPLIHFLLATHGILTLINSGGELWQWLMMGVVTTLGIFGLINKRLMKRISLFSFIYILVIAWLLMFSTGGTASFFFLWYFVLVSTFPIARVSSFRKYFHVAASVSYLVLIPFSEQGLPIIVVLNRAFLLLAVGWIVQTLALSTERGYAKYRKSELRLSNMLETANDAIISVDQDQNLIIFNQGAERIFGYNSENILGQPLDILMSADISLLHRYHIEDFSKSETVSLRMAHERDEIKGKRKDGSLFPIEASFSKYTENGHFVYTSILRDITDRKQKEKDLNEAHSELKLAYDETLEGWAFALSLRDSETEEHTRRVTDKTVLLAKYLDYPEDELEHMRRGALLHDMGKIGIPDAILLKPGPLNDQEWEVMKLHPTHASEFISRIEFLRPVVDIPACHHEKWDGSGYPNGLKGEEIPFAARIFAVNDIFDALSNDRPYRKAWSEEKILAYIQDQSGKHFDPAVVIAFMQMFYPEREENQ